MMKDNSPTSEVPQDRVDLGARAHADWPLEQVKQLALELYVRFPFDDEDTERWKDLAREAFWVFDNLDEACREILRERSEDRKADARERDADTKLPSVAPFDTAVRYLTGEKHTDRARSKFDKVLSYEARIVPWQGRVLPQLPAKEKRRIETQTGKWRENGIRRFEALRLQSLFERYWPRVVAEQNSAKRNRKRKGKRKRKEWPDARRIAALERTFYKKKSIK
jgi:hypothetical protein